MKNFNIYIVFLIPMLFSACMPTNIRFIEPQPEHLEKLSIIPSKFQGKFVINKDTVIVTDYTINGDSINLNNLVVKGWGNYLFVNYLENEVYKLGCAKMVKTYNHEKISLEYFMFLETDRFTYSSEDKPFKETMEKMIADNNNPLVRIDSTEDLHFILDNVNLNHFQSLLNNAKSDKVTRIK